MGGLSCGFLNVREKPLLEKYEKEFNEHGLDRIEIRRDN